MAERTPHSDDSLLVRPLAAITAWSLRAPATVLVGAAALALVCVAITIHGLTFKTDRLDLLNPRSEYNRRWLAYLAEFGHRDDAVIVFQTAPAGQPSPPGAAERMTSAIDELAGQLRADGKHFESVFQRRDLSALRSKALHYLPGVELAKIEEQLKAAASLAPGAGQPADPVAALAGLNEQLSRIGTASPQQRETIEEHYARAAGLLLAALQGGAPPPSGAGAAGLAELEAQFRPQYLLADKGRLGFVLTKLVGDADAAAQAIDRLRELIAAARTRHPDLRIGLTGMPVIEHDEMQASQYDMVWTSMVSMAVVLMLYLACYGGLRHAILVNVLLLLATAYSFGFVTLAVGHLNILSSAFSAVLIGIGIDFSIHYIASYLALRKAGSGDVSALMRMATEVGPGMVTGGVTTAAAFFMAAMTDFVGVRELGLIAGGAILLCVLSAVVVLPPLLLVVDRHWPIARLPMILPAGRWLRFPLAYPRLVIAGSLAATVALALGATRLRYDHNLLNLQPRHLESAELERELFTSAEDSVWYAVSLCANRQELRARAAQFQALGVVAKTEEIAALVPDNGPEHAQSLKRIGERLAGIPESAPETRPVDAAELQRALATAHELLARETPFETKATAMLAALQGSLAALPPAEVSARLAQGQAAVWRGALDGANVLRAIADPAPPRLTDLPRELTDRFIGKSQTYLLKVYPRGNIWNMREMEAFVRAVESVDPRITGHPVQTFYASRHMQQSYIWAGVYALVAVLVLLWIDLRSLPHALLAMVPLAFGFVQMCGVIGWLDLPLNPANMIVLPLILGIGVDHGVHLVHLWRQQRGRFDLNDCTAVAVLLTATTTTASFGALILARHQGLQSLGQVLTLGVTTCLASSIIFFPALLKCLDRGPERATAQARMGSKASRPASVPPQPAAPMPRETAAPPAAMFPKPEPAAVAAPAAMIPPKVEVAAQQSIPLEAPRAPVFAPLAETQPAALPQAPVPLGPLPVTEEEIAALLESALSPKLPRASERQETEFAAEETEKVALPRRRNLPRRSDAA